MSDNESVVSQIVGLQPNQAFSRSFFLPAEELDSDEIRKIKRKLKNYLTPAVARARERDGKTNRRVHTSAWLTPQGGVVVTGVVVCNNYKDEEI
jgi:hypothetical protein